MQFRHSNTQPLAHHYSYTCINVVSVCTCRPDESFEELANAPAPLATVLNDKAKMDTEVSLVLLLLKSSLSLSVHFNGHFPGEPGLAGVN